MIVKCALWNLEEILLATGNERLYHWGVKIQRRGRMIAKEIDRRKMGSRLRGHVYCRHSRLSVNSGVLIIAGQPCVAWFACTPVLLPRRRANEQGEQGRCEWGGGRQVIRAITRQGSVTVIHICPLHLYTDRRGVDPDLVAYTNRSFQWPCVQEREWERVLLVTLAFIGL